MEIFGLMSLGLFLGMTHAMGADPTTQLVGGHLGGHLVSCN